MRRLLILAALLCWSRTSAASGFLLYEQSARALGKGSAAVADTDEPAAAWYNPAALSFGPRLALAASSALVLPRTAFTPVGGETVSARRRTHVVPSFFAQAALGTRVHLGAALLVPFGLAIAWPEDWIGEEESLETSLVVTALATSVAVRITDGLSAAAGLTGMRGTVALAAALMPQYGGRADLEGSGYGLGGSLAVLWRALPDRLQLGATYRSRARVRFRGGADFSPRMSGFEPALADGPAEATVTLPDLFAAGAELRPHRDVALSAQLDWVLWSTFDELVVRFDNPATPPQREARAAKNPLTARFGASWATPFALAVRGGVSFDGSTATSETLDPSAPDAARASFTAGVGYRWRALSFDLGYLHARYLDAEATGPARPLGLYRTRAHAVGLGIAFRTPE